MEPPLPLDKNLNKEFFSRELLLRVVSSLIAAPLVLAAILLGFPFFHLLAAVAFALACFEWSRITHRGEKSILWLVPLIFYLDFLAFGPNYLSPFVFLVCLEASYFSTKNLRSSFLPALGYTYITAAFIALTYLYDMGGYKLFTTLLCLVWSADIGAYFVGRTLKGPKLAPKISPSKTWSGFVGGTITAFFATYFLAAAFGLPLPPALLLSLIILSHLGDLLESATKRFYDVKDSGGILPGHGGILDRVDSLMLVGIGAALAHILGVFPCKP